MVPIRLPSLAELDFGSFEGKNYEQLKEDPAYRRWIDSAGMTAPPGGESGEDVYKRQTLTTLSPEECQCGEAAGGCSKPCQAWLWNTP